MVEPPPAENATQILRGIFLVVLAYAIVTIGDAAAKWCLPIIGAASVMFWRGIFGAATVAVLARSPERLIPRNWKLLTLRNVIHCVSSLLWYIAWLHVGLAESYAVAFVVPLLMTLLAIPILGEQIRWRRMLSIIVGFCGMLVMLRPDGGLWRPEILPMIGAVLLLAVSRVLTRLLARTESPECVSFTLMLSHLLLAFPMFWLFPFTLPIDIVVWVTLVVLGISNGIAHWLFARAYGLAPIGAIAPYEYTPLLWGCLLGYLTFNELPDRNTLFGAAIVAAAGLYNLHRERVRKRQAA